MSEASAMGPTTSTPRSGSWFSASRAIIGVLVILLILGAIGAYLVYSNDQQTIADGRQQAATLTTQLAKSQQETKDRQAELDTTKTQLASTQTDLTAAQANGKSLSDQLAKSQQDVQAGQASVKDLQDKNASLTTSLNQAQQSAQKSQADVTALNQKITKATAKAQLVAEYATAQAEWLQGKDNTKWNTSMANWIRHLDALGDATINKYFDEYYAAKAKNPKDTEAFSAFIDKTLAYLSSGVVDGLK